VCEHVTRDLTRVTSGGRARTCVYAPCTLFTIMRSLHRPGSRRSSNSERQGQTRTYMDGWTNTTYAFVLVRSFVHVHVVGSALNRTTNATPCTATRERARSSLHPSAAAAATETIDHHPRSTGTISDMLANICRAKHTNTIQCCLPGHQWYSIALAILPESTSASTSTLLR